MINDTQIQSVIDRVMSELHHPEPGSHGPRPKPVVGVQPPLPSPSPRHGDNLFPDVDSAVTAGRAAFDQLQELPLSVREKMIAQIRRTMRENAQPLAYEAWQETGMGRYEDKIEKILLNADKSPGTEVLQPTAWTGDGGLTVVEYAPYGLIGTIIPSTNPISTVISNSICMVSAGNAVLFNAHPGARTCSNTIHATRCCQSRPTRVVGSSGRASSAAAPTLTT